MKVKTMNSDNASFELSLSGYHMPSSLRSLLSRVVRLQVVQHVPVSVADDDAACTADFYTFGRTAAFRHAQALSVCGLLIAPH